MDIKATKINIPKGWKTSELFEVADIIMGQSPVSSSYNQSGEGLPFFQGKADFTKKLRMNVRYWTSKPAKLSKSGDILLSVRAPVGDVAVSDMDACIGRGLAAIRAKSGISDQRFLFQLMLSLKKFLNTKAQGSTFSAINGPALKKIPVIVPTISEQKKIAEILSSVDDEIQKNDEIITQTEKLKKGLVTKLFSNQKDTKTFTIKKISEVTSSKRVMVSDYVDEGIPFYRSTEIIKKSKNIPVSNPYYISMEKFNFFKDRFGAPEEGDLLVTAVGTIGDVYLVQNETFYFKDGNTIWIRKIKDTVLPKYLKMILASSLYREKLNSIAGGSSQKALTIQKMEGVEVPVPTIEKQESLIKILSSIEDKTDSHVQLKEKLIQLKKGLMSDLLSGKVRT